MTTQLALVMHPPEPHRARSITERQREVLAVAHLGALDTLLADDNLVRRFFEKCVPEPNTGCWLWEFGCDKDGYGKFQITNHGEGPKQYHVRAHRFALGTRLGRMPRQLVLHRCDTPSCVNPSHLREGTQQENIREMDSRGRRPRGYTRPGARGERHPRSLLTEAQARIAIARLAAGDGQAQIARDLGVRPSTINNIKRGSAWKHLREAA